MAGGGATPRLGAGVGLQGSNADRITWSASFSIPKVWHWLTNLFG
jgi:hypothetical protein